MLEFSNAKIKHNGLNKHTIEGSCTYKGNIQIAGLSCNSGCYFKKVINKTVNINNSSYAQINEFDAFEFSKTSPSSIILSGLDVGQITSKELPIYWAMDDGDGFSTVRWETDEDNNIHSYAQGGGTVPSCKCTAKRMFLIEVKVKRKEYGTMYFIIQPHRNLLNTPMSGTLINYYNTSMNSTYAGSAMALCCKMSKIDDSSKRRYEFMWRGHLVGKDSDVYFTHFKAWPLPFSINRLTPEDIE